MREYAGALTLVSCLTGGGSGALCPTHIAMEKRKRPCDATGDLDYKRARIGPDGADQRICATTAVR
jgi:hypothetical protein